NFVAEVNRPGRLHGRAARLTPRLRWATPARTGRRILGAHEDHPGRGRRAQHCRSRAPVPREGGLCGRVRRRWRGGARPGPAPCGNGVREATVNDRLLELRARDFDRLVALARDPGVVLTRDALLEDVWGTDFPGETRTVDVHVGEVRKKLGDDAPAIETLRGIGYRLVPPTREPVRRPVDGQTPDRLKPPA